MSFEFDIKEYFKDKINWKLFNHLKDCCVDYEDDGWIISVNVLLYLNYNITGCLLLSYNSKQGVITEEWNIREVESTYDYLHNSLGSKNLKFLSYRISVSKRISINKFQNINSDQHDNIKKKILRVFTDVNYCPDDKMFFIEFRQPVWLTHLG